MTIQAENIDKLAMAIHAMAPRDAIRLLCNTCALIIVDDADCNEGRLIKLQETFQQELDRQIGRLRKQRWPS